MKLKHFFVILIFLPLLMAFSPPADFPDVCQESGNILRNCDFSSGTADWNMFLEAGHADFSVLQGGGECHAPLCPAGYIVTHDHFIGGIYQQVSVTPGNSYYANIVWLVFDSLINDASLNSQVGGGIGRRIGIDPYGGTDSRSPNVVWSEDNWRNDCKICNVEHVTVTAQADTVTVFLRLDDTWRLRAAEMGFAVPPSKDQFWIDDIGMKQVGEGPAPPPTEPPPTETPVPPPPTDTPVPVPPTETPEPEEVVAVAQADTTELESPTENVQPETPVEDEMTTDEAVSVAEATTDESVVEEDAAAESIPPAAVEQTNDPAAPVNTVAPPPTLTPTPIPTATSTRIRPTAVSISEEALSAPAPNTEAPLLSAGLIGLVGTTACLGGLVLFALSLVVGGMVWLYRLGWGSDIYTETKDTTDAA